VSPRRAPGESRRAILEAARHQFAAVGYQRATIRAIARAAGVDPALVIQYFGSKDELLDASLEMPVDLASVTADIDGYPDLGTELVRRALTAWDEGPIGQRLLAMLRTGLSHQRAAEALAAMVSRSVLAVVERFATGEDARFRAALVGSQIAGLAMGRLALRVPELTEASPERIARAVGPAITRYLTGDIGAGADGTPAV
jgi:AcrR family transcriptional regulator